MTRKDYVMLAAALKDAQPPSEPAPIGNDTPEGNQHAQDCRAICAALARENPRFDSERFLIACGVNQ